MKTLTILAAAMVWTWSASAQKLSESEIPAEVKAAAKKLYPDLKVSQWEREKGNYEAEYKGKGYEKSVVMDVAGNVLELEESIDVNSLPQAARDYIKANYKSARIAEASKIFDATGTEQYEAEVNKKDLIFDSNGNFLRIEEDDDDEKGDD